jgi:tetratricopeptide (TPR) repeat protein
MDRRAIVILLALGASAFGDPAYFRIGSGNKLYAEGKYEEALAEYSKAKSADPARHEADYNMGAAQFKTGRFKESAGAFERAMGSGNAEMAASAGYNRSASLYSAGVSAKEAGELNEAMPMLKASAEGYKAALRERPSDSDIRHNLELALEKLKEAEKQKQEQDSRDKDEQNKKEKDGAGKDGQPKEDKKPSEGEKKTDHRNDGGSGKKQEMTAEEAERALAAVQSDEKDLRKKIRNQNMKERPKSGKDW